MKREMTREEWLNAVARKLMPMFATAGKPIKNNLRITLGFPSQRALSNRRRTMGQCWPSHASDDKGNEVFINPTCDNAIEAAAILVHEMSHAALDCAHGHKGPFVKLIR